MSFEFNGLLDSVLPNIYINRITLEQLNSRPPLNKKNDQAPHIRQEFGPKGEPSLASSYGSYEDILKVTFDLFLEIPNISSDDFWSFLFDDEISKYLSINLLLFSGQDAKQYYKYLVGQQSSAWANTKTSILDVTNSLDAGGTSFWSLERGSDFEYKSEKSIFTQLMGPDKFVAGAGTNESQKLVYIKQKYSKTLPDGTIVYKIPIRIETQLDGVFPDDLAAIAFCGLDTSELLGEFAKAGMGGGHGTIVANAFGRVATEVIIRNKKLQDKGMMFFISNDQSVINDKDLSAKREAAFSHLKGELWFGSVQLTHPTKGRYMAGSGQKFEESGPKPMKPFLDYTTVPNQRIQDFRQLTTMKHMANFNPVTNLVFGGDYVDSRSTTKTATFEKLPIFSNLISSIDKLSHIKLFFSIDWGKLIKQECAVPALIDKLSDSPSKLSDVLGASLTPISFRVFRERVDVSNKIINDSKKQLIYDGYPNLYYFDSTPAMATTLPKVISSLSPVKLHSKATVVSGRIKHYSLTDYDVENTTKGKFRYSVEIELHDPTLAYFQDQLKLIKQALNKLKKYTYLANGTHGNQLYYNSHLGQFEEQFKILAGPGTNKIPGLGFSGLDLPEVVSKAIDELEFMTRVMRSDYVSPMAGQGIGGEKNISIFRNFMWQASIANMLNPDNATPDSIEMVYEIFSTLASQLKNFIQSFAIAKIPKTGSAKHTNQDGSTAPVMENFTKMPIGASTPQRKITIEYSFADLTELVDTTNMDGVCDFFGDLHNLSKYSIGLKLISYSGNDSFSEKSSAETARYFHENKFPGAAENAQNKMFTIPFREGNLNKQYDLETSTTTTKGQFFTLRYPEKHVYLPTSVIGAPSKTPPSDIVNNIIRYKFGLYGNPDKTSYLGYFVNTHFPDIHLVDSHMKTILKAYQSLANKGAVFVHEQYAKPGDPLMSKGIAGPLDYTADIGEPQWLSVSDLAPPPDDSGYEPMPTGSQNAQEISVDDTTRIPWAANEGQSRFLLALIMQDYFNLEFKDIKLGTFNANVSKSSIGTYLNGFIHPSLASNFFSWSPRVKSALDNLPNQIKVLMANHVEKLQNSINETVQYFTGSQLYDSSLAGTNDKTMFIKNFGEFWFKHQNLVQVEYLSGYEKITRPPPGSLTKYETAFPSSVKLPVWTPLDLNYADKLNSTADGLVLCRLKKYRHPIFNQKVYDVLDLPLYNEHFFLYMGQFQTAAIFEAPPTKTIKIKEP